MRASGLRLRLGFDVVNATSFFVACVVFAARNAFALDQFPTSLNCEQLSDWDRNLGGCAKQRADDFIRQHAGSVQRTSNGLRIVLDDGRKVTIRRDCAVCLDPIALHAQSRLLLVREQFSEGNTWWLFSLKTGRGVETEGWPLFSPNGRWLFAFSGMDESGWTRPVARIYDTGGDKPTLLWRGLTMSKRKEGGWMQVWAANQPKWHSDEKLSFDVEEWRSSATGSGTVTTGSYVVRFVDGEWLAARYAK